eukprot:9324862-Pyramimonas_sp.AAC.1
MLPQRRRRDPRVIGIEHHSRHDGGRLVGELIPTAERWPRSSYSSSFSFSVLIRMLVAATHACSC